ncbi:hypothetical protein LCGC14_1150350 [marine sediment metagenome]|uniref:Uncharacterized protein n=1 Tax=marine sediment metagenome TaxID=412755 RepID=A0A0F9M0K9_9ZZZZ
MIYKLLRWSRQLRIFFGGNKAREDRFKLFEIHPRIGDIDFRRKLIPLGYQENLFSHTFKHQIATVRRLALDGKHQYHLRLYSDGVCTGHYEMDYYLYQKEHLAGKDLRKLTRVERVYIADALGV